MYLGQHVSFTSNRSDIYILMYLLAEIYCLSGYGILWQIMLTHWFVNMTCEYAKKPAYRNAEATNADMEMKIIIIMTTMIMIMIIIIKLKLISCILLWYSLFAISMLILRDCNFHATNTVMFFTVLL